MSQRQMIRNEAPQHGLGIGLVVSILLWMIIAVVRAYM